MAFSDLLVAADIAVREVLGGSVTYTPTVGAAVTVDGIFDAAYVLVDAGQPGMSSAGPAVFLTLTDLPSDPEVDTGALITVAAVEYSIHTVKADGLGGAYLLLHRTS